MTGFGLGVARLGSGRVSAEVRSLNHRYLDVRVRLPPDGQEHAFFVEQLCRERLSRGRYDLSIRFEGLGGNALELDTARARSALVALAALRDELAPEQELPLALLASVPDLFRASNTLELSSTRAALEQACTTAFVALDKMRSEEGRALELDLTQRLVQIDALLRKASELTRGLVQNYETRLRERLQRLLTDIPTKPEPARIELEVALLADKSDVAEELTRLASHVRQFGELMQKAEPVGRALDFLLQEMAREANTIGAKCADADVSYCVIELKSELERLREQVQNVE